MTSLRLGRAPDHLQRGRAAASRRDAAPLREQPRHVVRRRLRPLLPPSQLNVTSLTPALAADMAPWTVTPIPATPSRSPQGTLAAEYVRDALDGATCGAVLATAEAELFLQLPEPVGVRVTSARAGAAGTSRRSAASASPRRAPSPWPSTSSTRSPAPPPRRPSPPTALTSVRGQRLVRLDGRQQRHRARRRLRRRCRLLRPRHRGHGRLRRPHERPVRRQPSPPSPPSPSASTSLALRPRRRLAASQANAVHERHVPTRASPMFRPPSPPAPRTPSRAKRPTPPPTARWWR